MNASHVKAAPRGTRRQGRHDRQHADCPRRPQRATAAVMALRGEIANLDPLVTATGDSQQWGLQMYTTRRTRSWQRGKMQPQLATGYQDLARRAQCTYTLRGGVKFPQRRPAHAGRRQAPRWADVRPATAARRPQFAPFIESIEDSGSHARSRSSSRRQDGVALSARSRPFSSSSELRAKFATPARVARPRWWRPFKFIEQKIGQYTRIERFDDYWGPKPAIKRIIYKLIPEPNSRVNAPRAARWTARGSHQPDGGSRRTPKST